MLDDVQFALLVPILRLAVCHEVVPSYTARY